MDKKQLLMIAAIAGALTAIGSLMAWYSISGTSPLGNISQSSGSIAGNTFEGKLIFLGGLAAALCAGGLFLGKKLPVPDKTAMLIALIGSVVAALLTLFNWPESTSVMGISGGPGIGFWLCLLGSLAATAASFMGWQKLGGTLPKPPSGDNDGDNDGDKT